MRRVCELWVKRYLPTISRSMVIYHLSPSPMALDPVTEQANSGIRQLSSNRGWMHTTCYCLRVIRLIRPKVCAARSYVSASLVFDFVM